MLRPNDPQTEAAGVNLFLTGTDTGVGKTYVASLLVRALRNAGHDTVGLKPICCGDRDDAESLQLAADGVISVNDINPVWLRTPAAPYTAAGIENRTIDLMLIRETFGRIRCAHSSIIVEGVGGWRVPITLDYFVGDLAEEYGLPVAIVVANKLGAINHALLTVESVQRRGLPCAGLILNRISAEDDIATATNRSVLEELTGLPILAELGYGQLELPADFLSPRLAE